MSMSEPDPITASEEYSRFRSSIPQRKVRQQPTKMTTLHSWVFNSRWVSIKYFIRSIYVGQSRSHLLWHNIYHTRNRLTWESGHNYASIVVQNYVMNCVQIDFSFHLHPQITAFLRSSLTRPVRAGRCTTPVPGTCEARWYVYLQSVGLRTFSSDNC